MISLQKKKEMLEQLRSISPLWTKVLANKKDDEDVGQPGGKLHIGDAACCIVGEAHGFDDDYTHTILNIEDGTACMACDKFCVKLVPLVYNINVSSARPSISFRLIHEKSWTHLENFIKHFKEKHSKK